MKYALFNTIEAYSAMNGFLSDIREYPRRGTETYAPETPKQDINGKFVMPVIPEFEEHFADAELTETPEYPIVEEEDA